MRPRLTASFVVLSLVLLLGALGVRSYSVYGALRSHESEVLQSRASTIALLLEQRVDAGQPIDAGFLTSLVDTADRLSYDAGQGSVVTAEGGAYGNGGEDPIEVVVDTGDGLLVLTRSGEVVAELADNDLGSIGFLVLLCALLAAMVGYVMARVLSQPFRQLAGAAEQLGRGRFDLDLPRTQIPEARAISQALQTSAGQLQERLASEQAFAEHASHVLRTPLTGLRLELEDLAMRDDVPDDVRASATRSVGRIEAMNAVAGDLVAMARRGELVAGAQIPLRELATQVAQTWVDALAEQDRELTAAVEGDIETTYTPGPVEHILDLLLADVLRRGEGAVRLVFESGAEGSLAIELSCAGLSPVTGSRAAVVVTQARAIVTALGGHLTGDFPDRLAIRLPRR